MNTRPLRLAGFLGTITATTCVVVTLPELLENVSYLGFVGYTLGVFILTNKLNDIYRKGN
jgi:hypothetical protein